MIKYGILHRDIKPANIFIHNNVCKIGMNIINERWLWFCQNGG
jgi:hypothetical protein